MSVNAGGKPIVTDKLVHLLDPLSNVCYPSGSDELENHFSEGHVKSLTGGFGTNLRSSTQTGFTTSGLADYGAETDHRRQKGYWVADGSSDYLTREATSNAYLPIKGGLTGQNYPSALTFGGWFKCSSLNSTTRYLFGFGNTGYSNDYYCTAYINSSGYPYFHSEPGTNSYNTSITTSIEDDTWHLWFVRIRGTSSSQWKFQLFIDGGLWGSSSEQTQSPGTYIGGNSNMKVYSIGTVRRSTYQNSHLGDIGPHYIYAKALSTAEMQQNYFALKDRFNF